MIIKKNENIENKNSIKFFWFNQLYQKNFRKVRYPENTKIGGKRLFRKADESNFGKEKKNCDCLIDKIWIKGIVERSPAKNIILYFVVKKKKTIENFFIEYIYTNIFFYTDKCR